MKHIATVPQLFSHEKVQESRAIAKSGNNLVNSSTPQCVLMRTHSHIESPRTHEAFMYATIHGE